MLMQKATDARTDKRSVFKAIFYFLLARLGVRRLRGHSFFALLLAKPAVVADFGAYPCNNPCRQWSELNQ